MPEVTAWQNRPLEKVYPFIFMDAIHYKVKEDRRRSDLQKIKVETAQWERAKSVPQ